MSDEKSNTGMDEKLSTAPKKEKHAGKNAENKEKDYVKLVKAKLIEYRSEFKKIIWPSRKELAKKSVTVILTSALFAIIIFGFDSIFTLGTQTFFMLAGK